MSVNYELPFIIYYIFNAFNLTHFSEAIFCDMIVGRILLPCVAGSGGPLLWQLQHQTAQLHSISCIISYFSASYLLARVCIGVCVCVGCECVCVSLYIHQYVASITFICRYVYSLVLCAHYQFRAQMCTLGAGNTQLTKYRKLFCSQSGNCDNNAFIRCLLSLTFYFH